MYVYLLLELLQVSLLDLEPLGEADSVFERGLPVSKGTQLALDLLEASRILALVVGAPRLGDAAFFLLEIEYPLLDFLELGLEFLE